MLDAVLLAQLEWRPARLEDIHELPDRTLRLYLAYRAGQQNRRSTPAGWGTIGGVPVKGG